MVSLRDVPSAQSLRLPQPYDAIRIRDGLIPGSCRAALGVEAGKQAYGGRMTIKVTATEAKAKILALLDEVAAGQDVEITRHGRPVARMVPATGPHALKDVLKGVAMSTVKDEDLYSTGVKWNVERRRSR